jgi:hypothetical protein
MLSSKKYTLWGLKSNWKQLEDYALDALVIFEHVGVLAYVDDLLLFMVDRCVEDRERFHSFADHLPYMYGVF